MISCISLTFSIRFETYNIQSSSNIEHVQNLTVTAKTIKQLGFDVLALQEVDNFTIRHPTLVNVLTKRVRLASMSTHITRASTQTISCV